MVNYFQQLPDQGQEQASAIAKGFGGGLTQGFQTGLSQQLSGFLQQKKELGKAATNVNMMAKRYGKDAYDATKLAELQNRTTQLIKEENLSAQDAALLAFQENDQKAEQEQAKNLLLNEGKSEGVLSKLKNAFDVRSFEEMPEKDKKIYAKTLYSLASLADFPSHISDALQFGTRKLISLAKGQNDEEFQESENKRSQLMKENSALFPTVKPFTESLLEYTGGRGPGENPFERIAQSAAGGPAAIAAQSVSELIDAYGQDLPEWAKPFAESLAFVVALKYGKGRGLKASSVKANEKLLKKAGIAAAERGVPFEEVLQQAKNESGANFDKALKGDASEINKLSRAISKEAPGAEKVTAAEKTVFNPKEAIKQREAHAKKLETSPFRENLEIENRKAAIEAGKTPETRAKEAQIKERVQPEITKIENKIDLMRKDLNRMESFEKKYTGPAKDRLKSNIEFQKKAIDKQLDTLKDLRYELKTGKPRPTEVQLEIEAQNAAKKIVDQVRNPTPENIKAFEDQLAKDQRFLKRAEAIRERGEFDKDFRADEHIRINEKYQKAYDVMVRQLRDEINSLKGARDAESLKKIADNREAIKRLEQRQKRQKANITNQKEKIIALKSIEGPSGALYKNQIKRVQGDLKEFQKDFAQFKERAETKAEIGTEYKGQKAIKEAGKEFEKVAKVGEEVGKNPTNENISKAVEETGLKPEEIKTEQKKLGEFFEERSERLKEGKANEKDIRQTESFMKEYFDPFKNAKAAAFHFGVGNLIGVIENEFGFRIPRNWLYGGVTVFGGRPTRIPGRSFGFSMGHTFVNFLYDKAEGSKLKELRKNPIEYSRYIQSLKKRYGPKRINKMIEYSKN